MNFEFSQRLASCQVVCPTVEWSGSFQIWKLAGLVNSEDWVEIHQEMKIIPPIY